MARSMSTAPRAPYDGLRPAFDALMRKKDASLSNGAFARDPRPGVSAIVHARNRSRFAAAVVGRDAGADVLGMGVVQAILAALTGAVRAVTWDADGRRGRATIDGIGSGETYQMSWDDQRPPYLLLGGFVNGATYQVALLALVMLWTQRAVAPDRAGEVIERWWTLVRAMDARYARPDRTSGWDVSQVKAACQDIGRNADIRDAIEALADALTFALRYALPALDERGLYVQYAPCVSASAYPHCTASGAALLTLPTEVPSVDRTAVPGIGLSAASAPAAADDTMEDDLDLDRVPDEAERLPEAADGPTHAEDDASEAEEEASDAARVPVDGGAKSPSTPSAGKTASATPPDTSSAAEPASDKRTRRRKPAADAASTERRPNAPVPTLRSPALADVPLVGGSVQTRIARAFAREGDVFLFGATATGKTTWAKRAAIDHGYGLEIVVFKPGLRDEMLYGTSVQNLDGRWVWQDGPIVRAARRAADGERIVLLLDELPRGDKSVVAGTMELMNVYSAADLVAQCLPLPDEGGPYRVVRVFDTQETLLFPAARLKIVATANLGDKYQGNDLSDPAFRRRWAGGWLELEDYGPDDTAKILATHLHVPWSHALVRALINVDRDVQSLQRADESLVMPTNLATLITWGKEVVRLAAASEVTRKDGRPQIKALFVMAAQDLWMDMLTPLAGDRRDPEVYRQLLTIVQRHAPDVL
jgi:hypothetical protein